MPAVLAPSRPADIRVRPTSVPHRAGTVQTRPVHLGPVRAGDDPDDDDDLGEDEPLSPDQPLSTEDDSAFDDFDDEFDDDFEEDEHDPDWDHPEEAEPPPPPPPAKGPGRKK